MKLIDLLIEKDMDMEYGISLPNCLWRVKTSVCHWNKDADTKKDYAINFYDDGDKLIDGLSELTAEQFDEFLDDLIKFRETLNTTIKYESN